MKVMVIGASGALGQLICKELIHIFGSQLKLIVTDYKRERGEDLTHSMQPFAFFEHLDATNSNDLNKKINNVDIVVVSLNQTKPLIQEVCIKKRITCIDVSPFGFFVNEVEKLHNHALQAGVSSIVMSGFLPGLSGIMVNQSVQEFEEVRRVDVGLLQNTNAKAGISGIIDMLHIVSQNVVYKDIPHDSCIKGFTKKQIMSFNNPVGNKEVRLIQHDEKMFLSNKLSVPQVNYWTAWNEKKFNRQIALLRTTGILRLLTTMSNANFLSKAIKHNPNKSEDAHMTVEVIGTVDKKHCKKTIMLSSPSDYHLTAMVTAALAKIVAKEKKSGVLFPFQLTDVRRLLGEIDREEIIYQEKIEFITKLVTPKPKRKL